MIYGKHVRKADLAAPYLIADCEIARIHPRAARCIEGMLGGGFECLTGNRQVDDGEIGVRNRGRDRVRADRARRLP